MDRAATFDSLFDEHRRAIHAYLLGRTADRELAADLLQETFLRVWRNLDAAASVPPTQRRYYLLAVARSISLDSRRRQRKCIEQPLDGVEISAGTNVLDAYARKRDLERIDREIMALPEDLRMVMTMHVMGDMTSAEVGQVLGRPAGTIRYQLSEARKRVARKLGMDVDQ